MIVLNLGCPLGHAFEGWFGSSDDCESQRARGLLRCPMCDSADVQRLPNAPRLNVAHLKAAKGSLPPAQPGSKDKAEELHPASQSSEAVGAPAASVQARFLQSVRTLLDCSENVGEQFADEARRMHYGEAQARPIRGRTTADEALALLDEGIEVLALPAAVASSDDLH